MDQCGLLSNRELAFGRACHGHDFTEDNLSKFGHPAAGRLKYVGKACQVFTAAKSAWHWYPLADAAPDGPQDYGIAREIR